MTTAAVEFSVSKHHFISKHPGIKAFVEGIAKIWSLAPSYTLNILGMDTKHLVDKNKWWPTAASTRHKKARDGFAEIKLRFSNLKESVSGAELLVCLGIYTIGCTSVRRSSLSHRLRLD